MHRHVAGLLLTSATLSGGNIEQGAGVTHNLPACGTRHARNRVNVQRLTAFGQVSGYRKVPTHCRNAMKATV